MAIDPSAAGPHRPEKRPSTLSLLDLEPDLRGTLGEPVELALHRATVSTIALANGPWDPRADAGVRGATGFLVTEGLVVREILLASGVCSDLLGPGDIVSLEDDDDALVPTQQRWTVSAPSRIAVIDEPLLALLERWPQVAARLVGRAARQTTRMAHQRAISQLPRVDQRLLALFWSLAERWGRVGPHGVIVDLALTHETLGRMVGARRPTVSLALKELAAEGTVLRRGDGSWVLRPDSTHQLDPGGLDAAAELPPDAVSLAPATVAGAPPLPAPRGHLTEADLHGRVTNLTADHLAHQARVRAVLERCETTRGQVIRARRERLRRALGEPPAP